MLLPKEKKSQDGPLSLIAEWPLTAAATLGSAVRMKGIEREVRAHLPWAVRKYAKAETGRFVLRMAEEDAEAFEAASKKIIRTVATLETLPVLPREAEDVLAISSRERHKWLKDGRLQSIGTRTVKMRGRSKSVTFHVFDPRHIEEVLDRDLPNIWREQDAEEVSRNRRRGANKAARTRADKDQKRLGKDVAGGDALEGWDAFEDEGLLR
ncbi:hypothetical protein [Mesorhizobium amorphae]|uniref:hypothetical protein n=1 Tax=Mesorhizobium amorphae TaxID=71433 RepID=UPI0011836E34|nr:hypothetical protein [Mesorhizobium amorphae]